MFALPVVAIYGGPGGRTTFRQLTLHVAIAHTPHYDGLHSTFNAMELPIIQFY